MEERRLSQSETPAERENVFDDAFAVDEDIDMIADGFRPSLDHDREGGEQQDTPSSSTRPISRQQTPTPSRNSTRKSRPQENPFASPDDVHAEPLLRRTPSGNYLPISHRSVSSASSGQFARTGSQRLGGAGPSHPYAMYPQGTLARTTSVASTSTVRQGRSTPRPTGPQHPYSLYPQGVSDDLDDEHENVQDSVPIGFTGLGQSYQRQRGPDGEEQDLVGYYGHAEQLPPYSRYPDDGPEKQPLLSVPDAPAPPAAAHSHAPVEGTDPSMPLMHAQIQPTPQPPQSMTDESELTRQASNARSSENLLGGSDSTRGSDISDKAWSEKSWKERRKTRVCGVPCWWFIVVLVVVLFVLVVSGGAVGGFVAGQRKAEQKFGHIVTTTGYDASIISTPTSTVPLPTGTWALNLGPAQQPQAQCLTTPQQRVAWDCHLAYGNELAIHVQTPHDGPQSGAYLYYVNNPYEPGLTYGSQTMQMNTTFSPFIWVHDVDQPGDEPALYWKTSYDKLVVLPEDALDISSKKIKRDNAPHWFEGQTAQPSSRPWYCFWNDTLLEGFIYPNKQIRRLPSSAMPSASYSTPAWASTITASPTQTITTTLTMSSTTATYTGAASAFPKWLHDKYPNFNMTTYTTAPTNEKRDDHDPDEEDEDIPDNVFGLKVYPYQIKLEERRLPGSPLPYCVQYQVLNDGFVNWIPGTGGQQVVIQLNEKNPPFRPVLYPEPPHGSRSRRKRNESPESCHCQWMSGAE